MISISLLGFGKLLNILGLLSMLSKAWIPGLFPSYNVGNPKLILRNQGLQLVTLG
jgi:hypothetical protein